MPFAIALMFKTDRAHRSDVSLGALVAVPHDGLPVPLQTWSNAIILHFLGGIALGLIRKGIPSDLLLPARASPLAIAAALARQLAYPPISAASLTAYISRTASFYSSPVSGGERSPAKALRLAITCSPSLGVLWRLRSASAS
jgi:hypothetical protein